MDRSPHLLSSLAGVNGGSGDFALYCPLHTQEVLKLFCETCDVLTCHSCLMVEHKEHRWDWRTGGVGSGGSALLFCELWPAEVSKPPS